MKVTAIVEKGSDGLYSIYSDQEIGNHSFGGFGESLDAAKADFMQSIEKAKEMIKAETGTIPDEFTDVQVSFKFDIPSFFNCFNFLSVSAFAKYAGINPSLMRQYKQRLAFASESQMAKIEDAIHKVGNELLAVSL